MATSTPSPAPTSKPCNGAPPRKKRALTPNSMQAANVEALFANPDREVIPQKKEARGPAPPPEIVANVQGSSAGAGSGEFHVYKASRRREYERLERMDREVREEEERKEFERKREEVRRKDEEKTAKNRKKREKLKMRQAAKKKGLKLNGETDEVEKMQVEKCDTKTKRLGPNLRAIRDDGEEDGAVRNEDGGEVKPMQEEVGMIIHDDD